VSRERTGSGAEAALTGRSPPARRLTGARGRRGTAGWPRTGLHDRPADRGGPDLIDHAEGLVGQTGSQADQGDQQPVVNTNSYFGPAPAWRRRSPRRRWRRADSHRASHRGASSVTSSPRCPRDSPQKAEWDMAARACPRFTPRQPSGPPARHRLREDTVRRAATARPDYPRDR